MFMENFIRSLECSLYVLKFLALEKTFECPDMDVDDGHVILEWVFSSDKRVGVVCYPNNEFYVSATHLERRGRYAVNQARDILLPVLNNFTQTSNDK